MSLLSLLLLVIIAALVVTTIVLRQELLPLRKEVRKLRAETGQLLIGAADQLYAVRLPSRDSLIWKWRVWIPEDLSYRVFVQVGNVASHRLPFIPPDPNIHLVGPAEYLIEYRVRDRDNPESSTSFLSVGSWGTGYPGHSWLELGAMQGHESGVGEATESFEVGLPVELFVKQVLPEGVAWNGMGETDGFRIWIAPSE